MSCCAGYEDVVERHRMGREQAPRGQEWMHALIDCHWCSTPVRKIDGVRWGAKWFHDPTDSDCVERYMDAANGDGLGGSDG